MPGFLIRRSYLTVPTGMQLRRKGRKHMRAASELCGLACLPATLAFDNPKSHSQAHTVEVEPQSDLNREVHSFYNKILRFEVRAYCLSWNLKWNLKATSIAGAQVLQQDIAIRSSGLLLKLEPQTEPQGNLNRGCTVFTTRYCDLRF